MNTILSYGLTGYLVELLQSTLNKAGFFSDKIDGIFGINTQNAVKNFQSYYGLQSDGIVGNKTWNALLPFINGYVNYIVKSGDTLYSIAQKYNSTVNNILTANPNKNLSVIFPGQTIIIPFSYIVPTNVSYTYSIMSLNINALKTVFPFLEIGSIGKSVMGKNIPYIRLGYGKKEVFYNASFHANEWITSVLLMKFIENYCIAFRSNSILFGFDIKKLFDTVSVYIVPMVNPDGVDLVNGAIPKNSKEYIKVAKISNNFSSIPFPSGWKANINGVDLNLQFPAEWNKAKEIKFSQGFNKPAPRDYVGLRSFNRTRIPCCV